MKNYQQLTVEPSFSCIQLSGPKCVNCAKSLNWNLPFYLFTGNWGLNAADCWGGCDQKHCSEQPRNWKLRGNPDLCLSPWRSQFSTSTLQDMLSSGLLIHWFSNFKQSLQSVLYFNSCLCSTKSVIENAFDCNAVLRKRFAHKPDASLVLVAVLDCSGDTRHNLSRSHSRDFGLLTAMNKRMGPTFSLPDLNPRLNRMWVSKDDKHKTRKSDPLRRFELAWDSETVETVRSTRLRARPFWEAGLYEPIELPIPEPQGETNWETNWETNSETHEIKWISCFQSSWLHSAKPECVLVEQKYKPLMPKHVDRWHRKG